MFPSLSPGHVYIHTHEVVGGLAPPEPIRSRLSPGVLSTYTQFQRQRAEWSQEQHVFVLPCGCVI